MGPPRDLEAVVTPPSNRSSSPSSWTSSSSCCIAGGGEESPSAAPANGTKEEEEALTAAQGGEEEDEEEGSSWRWVCETCISLILESVDGRSLARLEVCSRRWQARCSSAWEATFGARYGNNVVHRRPEHEAIDWRLEYGLAASAASSTLSWRRLEPATRLPPTRSRAVSACGLPNGGAAIWGEFWHPRRARPGLILLDHDASWRFKEAPFEARDSADLKACGDDLVVHGGCLADVGARVAESWVLVGGATNRDTTEDEWVRLDADVWPTVHHSCDVVRDSGGGGGGKKSSSSLVRFGGQRYDGEPVNDCVVFDVAKRRTRHVAPGAPAPAARALHASCVVDNNLLVAGGIRCDGVGTLHDAWLLECGAHWGWTRVALGEPEDDAGARSSSSSGDYYGCGETKADEGGETPNNTNGRPAPERAATPPLTSSSMRGPAAAAAATTGGHRGWSVVRGAGRALGGPPLALTADYNVAFGLWRCELVYCDGTLFLCGDGGVATFELDLSRRGGTRIVPVAKNFVSVVPSPPSRPAPLLDAKHLLVGTNLLVSFGGNDGDSDRSWFDIAGHATDRAAWLDLGAARRHPRTKPAAATHAGRCPPWRRQRGDHFPEWRQVPDRSESAAAAALPYRHPAFHLAGYRHAAFAQPNALFVVSVRRDDGHLQLDQLLWQSHASPSARRRASSSAPAAARHRRGGDTQPSGSLPSRITPT